MTKLSLDRAGRFPVLELITPTKPKPDSAPTDRLFDAHLNRAQNNRADQPSAPERPTTATVAAPDPRQQAAKPAAKEDAPTERSESQATPPEAESNDTGLSDQSEAPVANNEPVTVGSGQEENNDRDPADDGDKVEIGEQAALAANARQALPTDEALALAEESQQVEQAASEIDGQVPAPKTSDNQSDSERNPKTKTATDQGLKVEAQSQGDLSDSGSEPAAPEITIQTDDIRGTLTESTEEAAPELQLDIPEQATLTQEKAVDELKLESSSEEEVAQEEGAEGTEENGQLNEKNSKAATKPSAKDSSATKENVQTNFQSENEPASQSKVKAENTQPQVAQNVADGSETDNGTGKNSRSERVEQGARFQGIVADGPKSAEVSAAAGPANNSENSSSVRPISGSSREGTLGRAGSSAHQAQATGNDASANVDRARFIQRVSRALHVAHERGGEVRLRLSPPELGNLTLELKLQDGVLTARMEAETPSARSLLLDNVSVLKERLAAQDIQVDRFDVDLMDQSPQDPQYGPEQDSADERQLRRPLGKPIPAKTQEADSAEITSQHRIQPGSGKLNVVI